MDSNKKKSYILYLFFGLLIAGCSTLRNDSSNIDLSIKILKSPEILNDLILDTNKICLKTYRKYNNGSRSYNKIIQYISNCVQDSCQIVLLESYFADCNGKHCNILSFLINDKCRINVAFIFENNKWKLDSIRKYISFHTEEPY